MMRELHIFQSEKIRNPENPVITGEKKQISYFTFLDNQYF